MTCLFLNKDKYAGREESVVQSVIPKAAARHTQALKERRRGSEGKGGREEEKMPKCVQKCQGANHTESCAGNRMLLLFPGSVCHTDLTAKTPGGSDALLQS